MIKEPFFPSFSLPIHLNLVWNSIRMLRENFIISVKIALIRYCYLFCVYVYGKCNRLHTNFNWTKENFYKQRTIDICTEPECKRLNGPSSETLSLQLNRKINEKSLVKMIVAKNYFKARQRLQQRNDYRQSCCSCCCRLSCWILLLENFT